MFGVVARTIDALGEDVSESDDFLGTGLFDEPDGSWGGVDVSGDDILGVFENGTWVVGEDDFAFGAFGLNEFFVVAWVIHSGEWVTDNAEEFSPFLKGEDILEWVDVLLIEKVEADKAVSDFIAWVAKDDGDLAGSTRDTF